MKKISVKFNQKQIFFGIIGLLLLGIIGIFAYK
ncbi:LPXTG cell wall anchor domain-containing protein, partial [Oenococcus oeni]